MSVKWARLKTLQMADFALCPFICSLMFRKCFEFGLNALTSTETKYK